MNFKEFKDKYKEFALGLDLKNELPIVYNIYKQKDSLVEGTDDIDDLYEIIDFCKKAKRDMMHKINLHIEHNYNKTKYIGFIAPVFFHLRCYLDYDALLNKTNKIIYNYKNINDDIVNRFENIFCNNGYDIFQYLFDNHIKEFKRGWQSELSYYYRRMFECGYIHQKPVPFAEWFNNQYDVISPIEKIKTLSEVENTNRKTHFYNALNVFKSNK